MVDDLKSGGAQIGGQTAGGATYYERVLAGSRSAGNRCYAGHRRLNGLQKAKPPPIRSSGGLLAIQPMPSLLLPRHALPGLAKPCPSQASPNPTYPTEPTEPQTPIAASGFLAVGVAREPILAVQPCPASHFCPTGVSLGKIGPYCARWHRVNRQPELTAAHRKLPLGMKATVTNLRNGKAIEVTINDRGPYASGRIPDLSKAAAEQLDGTSFFRIG
jgi:Lytic transglycolase